MNPNRTRFPLWLSLVAASPAMAIADGVPPASVRWDDLPNTNTVFAPTEYRSRAAWETRRAWLREQIRFAVGLWPEPNRTPLNATIFGKTEHADYTIEKVLFESYPGFFVTGNLYRPAKSAGRLPGVACPHGHWKNGRLHHDEQGSVIARCITLARLGAVVFCYDMIGFNDSKRQIEHVIDSPERSLWGIGSMALQTWNSIRVLDFLQSLPDVDGNRIGVTGASGGGTQTFILSALDDRVTVAAPVCMVSSIMQGGCPCENAPCLRIETNNMEIAACFAPKNLLLVSATGDWTKNTPTVEFPMIRKIYDLYGLPDNVQSVHFDAGHNYNLASRTAVYRFFARHLLNRPDADEVAETPFVPEPPANMLVFADRPLPKDARTVDQLTADLVATARKRLDSCRPDRKADLDEICQVLRTGLTQAVQSTFPAKTDVQIVPGVVPPHGASGWLTAERLAGNKTLIEKAGSALRATETYYVRNRRAVRALSLAPEQPSRPIRSLTICVHPNGLAAAEAMEDFVLRTMSKAKPGVVVFLEPFGTGANKAPAAPPASVQAVASRVSQPVDPSSPKPRGTTPFFSTFNRTDTAETIYDVLTALAGLLAEHGDVERVNLIGFDRMGPLVLLARALVPGNVTQRAPMATVVDMQQYDLDRDETYLKDLYVPHIRRIGGLQAAAAAAATSPILFHNVSSSFPARWEQAVGQTRGVSVRITTEPASIRAIADWIGAAK